MITGEQILRFRMKRRWTLRQMAVAVGVAIATLHRAETDDQSVTPLSLAKIDAGMKAVARRERESKEKAS